MQRNWKKSLSGWVLTDIFSTWFKIRVLYILLSCQCLLAVCLWSSASFSSSALKRELKLSLIQISSWFQLWTVLITMVEDKVASEVSGRQCHNFLMPLAVFYSFHLMLFFVITDIWRKGRRWKFSSSSVLLLAQGSGTTLWFCCDCLKDTCGLKDCGFVCDFLFWVVLLFLFGYFGWLVFNSVMLFKMLHFIKDVATFSSSFLCCLALLSLSYF